MAFCFKNTKKDIILTEKDEEDYRNTNICHFRGKEISIDKVRDHCHLTGKYRGTTHNKCNTNITQEQNSIIAFVFHKFGKNDCHLFSRKKLVKRMRK